MSQITAEFPTESNRSYFSSTIDAFLKTKDAEIIGQLASRYSNHLLIDKQRSAWKTQVSILKKALKNLDGYIYFEFSIPRMGKKVDNIVIINDTIFVIEFKIGSKVYDKGAQDQVIDYALDLKHFHEGSHEAKLVPVLVASEAPTKPNDLLQILDFQVPALSNSGNLEQTLVSLCSGSGASISPLAWENTAYKPTPTIIEATQALYNNHDVTEIARSGAGTYNLDKTAKCLSEIIDKCKNGSKKRKAICFVTGVPGAGKTLAGLNITMKRMNADESEHAVFLSGNGPLVAVLREALARDKVSRSKAEGKPVTKVEAKRETSPFIQNIHHFRDDNLKNNGQAPTEKVVVFDEAQRAWNKDKAVKFMKQRKHGEGFSMSEPEFLIDVMDRHEDWCTIICLIGGGQEINTGEAGLEGWLEALQSKFTNWEIYYSDQVVDVNEYLQNEHFKQWLENKATGKTELHLNTSVRAFKAKSLSTFVHELLELNLEGCQEIYEGLKDKYPIRITRNLEYAKSWLKEQYRGTERIGLIASSGARRLKADGMDVKNEIDAPLWFLNDKNDVRSSFFLEDVATEFEIQGLEIDYACVAWGANLRKVGSAWDYRNFKGYKWQNIKQEVQRDYLKNAYRVLLTRARQGMVIYIPEGSQTDHTRPASDYLEVYNYLREIGIEELR